MESKEMKREREREATRHIAYREHVPLSVFRSVCCCGEGAPPALALWKATAKVTAVVIDILSPCASTWTPLKRKQNSERTRTGSLTFRGGEGGGAGHHQCRHKTKGSKVWEELLYRRMFGWVKSVVSSDQHTDEGVQLPLCKSSRGGRPVYVYSKWRLILTSYPRNFFQSSEIHLALVTIWSLS